MELNVRASGGELHPVSLDDGRRRRLRRRDRRRRAGAGAHRAGAARAGRPRRAHRPARPAPLRGGAGAPCEPGSPLRHGRRADRARPERVSVGQRGARAARGRSGADRGREGARPTGCARPTCWRASAATSSPCCCRAPSRRRRSASARRSRTRSPRRCTRPGGRRVEASVGFVPFTDDDELGRGGDAGRARRDVRGQGRTAARISGDCARFRWHPGLRPRPPAARWLACEACGVRLAKFLAHAGVASRRAAERLIADGRVSVGGEVETNPATDVDDDQRRGGRRRARRARAARGARAQQAGRRRLDGARHARPPDRRGPGPLAHAGSTRWGGSTPTRPA